MKSKILRRFVYAGILPLLSVFVALTIGQSIREQKMIDGFDASTENFLTIHTSDGKNWVKANQGIVINVIMQNITDVKLSYTLINNKSPYAFSVSSEEGKVVSLTKYGTLWKQQQAKKTHVVTRFLQPTLAPGDKFKSFNILISQIYDMSVPGKYFITVSMDVRVGDKPQVIKSKPFPITVIDYNHGETTPNEAKFERDWEGKQQKEKQTKKQKPKKRITNNS